MAKQSSYHIWFHIFHIIRYRLPGHYHDPFERITTSRWLGFQCPCPWRRKKLLNKLFDQSRSRSADIDRVIHYKNYWCYFPFLCLIKRFVINYLFIPDANFIGIKTLQHLIWAKMLLQDILKEFLSKLGVAQNAIFNSLPLAQPMFSWIPTFENLKEWILWLGKKKVFRVFGLE